ncbi:hypothetical protein PFISCL1PPCAC_2683 [Pristionchus fissidentatus]|uniref:protein-tyrosine-phosphatase n=1 Tax=Pristionchus fissidentatus TaxID=1538716 RepID=A0AAV5UVU2_9BILA|nr:hypothetical protein PFISCL1PPCAC_2683 [Pristionchus fissidentatus]
MADIRGIGSMYRAGSSSFDCHDEASKDSAIGDCSNSCSSRGDSAAGAVGPTDFAAMHVGGAAVTTGTTQTLNRKMASMAIKEERKMSRDEKRRGEILALEEEEDDAGIMMDDENARDSSFVKMPPPTFIPVVARRVLGDISNRGGQSPLSSKQFSRSATNILPSSSLSTGGLKNRNRKRTNCASPFGAQCGKRWRVAESIDEHSETASTSFAARTLSMDGRSDAIDRSSVDENTVEFARPCFHRVQSTSVLEKGIYAPHHDENVPEPLDVFYRLPTLETVDSQAFRRIDGKTLAHLMRTMGDNFTRRYALIDCRYPYEYDGGHIKSATNVFDPALIFSRFFAPRTSLLKKEEGEERGLETKIPIFYCEFSQKRGPNMAAAVRALDRIRNQLAYPHVDHAEMYVLNGGYNGFHEQHGCAELCSQHAYTRMDDALYTEELKKFAFHKKSFSACATVSRLPPPITVAAKQARRAECYGSPTFAPRVGVERRPSRRALYQPSPTKETSAPAPLVNPQFS